MEIARREHLLFPKSVLRCCEDYFDTRGTGASAVNKMECDSDNQTSERDLNIGLPKFKEDSMTDKYLDMTRYKEVPSVAIKEEFDDEDFPSVRDLDLEHIQLRQDFVHDASQEHGFEIRKKFEIHEAMIKQELDIGPIVLQPRSMPHQHQSSQEVDLIVKKVLAVQEVVVKQELDIGPSVLQPKTTLHSHQSVVEVQSSSPHPGANYGIVPILAPPNTFVAQDHVYASVSHQDHTYVKTRVSLQHSDTTYDETLRTSGNDFTVYKVPKTNAENCRAYYQRKKAAKAAEAQRRGVPVPVRRTKSERNRTDYKRRRNAKMMVQLTKSIVR